MGKFVHHRSWMDDSGWAGLKLFNVVDSWVRRCAFINFNACLDAESCAYTSVLEVVLGGTMGHVSIGSSRRSTGMFLGLIEDRLEHQAQIVMGLGIVRFDPDGLFEVPERIGQARRAREDLVPCGALR